MSCLLARRARALKYSRRLGRGRPALRAQAIPQSPISAPCGCGGRAKCAECARVGETEASRPTGRKLGGLLRFSEPQSGPGWHGGGSQTGRPDGRGQISLASDSRPRQRRSDCDSAGLWPVLSDTAPVRAIARSKKRTNKRRGSDERKC